MKKILEKLKKDWIFFTIIIITIIVSLLVSFYCLDISDRVYRTSEDIETSDYIQDVKAGTIIEQKIIAKENNFQRIDIQFEPFKERYDIAGSVTIGIKDSKGNVLKEETITRNYIRENTVYEFKFDKQKESKENEYTLFLKFGEIKDGKEFFTVKKVNDSSITNEMTIDGIAEQGKLAIKEFYISNTKQAFFIIIGAILSIYAFGISTYIHYKKGIKPEKIFLITVPVICLFYVICMPTFKNHDEIYHWYRSYEVSTGHLMTGIDGQVLGTKMPASISKVTTDNWLNIKYRTIKENLNIRLEPENKVNLYSETSAVYSFVQYIPQGIGIFIARLFTDRVLLLAIAGRLMNLIISMICIYFAIKKIPFGKKIILLLSYIPIAIEGFSSLSPDAMTISVAFLYIAYILSLAFNKENNIIGKKQIVILSTLSIVMALCKIVYIPLVLLMFIIPKEKFKNGKKIKTVLLIALASCIVNLIWLGISSVYLSQFREGDSRIQVKNIFIHPIKYIQDCLYTLSLNTDSYITTMLGAKLGWGELVNIYSIIPYILFTLIIWITLSDETIKEKFKPYQKFIIFLTTIIIVGLIFTSLYVQWTTCGSDTILGIQGRYFIPILPLVILLIGSQIKLKTQYKDENITKSIGIIGTLIQICVVLQIVICHL